LYKFIHNKCQAHNGVTNDSTMFSYTIYECRRSIWGHMSVRSSCLHDWVEHVSSAATWQTKKNRHELKRSYCTVAAIHINETFRCILSSPVLLSDWFHAW